MEVLTWYKISQHWLNWTITLIHFVNDSIFMESGCSTPHWHSKSPHGEEGSYTDTFLACVICIFKWKIYNLIKDEILGRMTQFVLLSTLLHFVIFYTSLILFLFSIGIQCCRCDSNDYHQMCCCLIQLLPVLYFAQVRLKIYSR